MNKKWLNTVLSLVILIPALSGCGGKAVRKEITPKYRFETNKPIRYKLKGAVAVTADAMILKYTGNINLNAVLELTARGYDTNYGYKVEMTMKDIKVDGGDSQIQRAVFTTLNNLRTWYSTFYITPEGKITGLYHGRPNPMLSAYAQPIFPEFSDMSRLWSGYTFNTNIMGKSQEKFYIARFRQDTTVKEAVSPALKLAEHMEIKVYEKDNFEKSVEPEPMGTVDMNIDDIFDYLNGRLGQKTAFLRFDFVVPISKGILSYNISVNGQGKLELILDEAPL